MVSTPARINQDLAEATQELGTSGQVIVCAGWDIALESERGGIDLSEALAATGADYLVEADDDGTTVIVSDRPTA